MKPFGAPRLASTIFGFDLSLTATGWMVLEDGEKLTGGTYKSKLTGMPRLDDIQSALHDIIQMRPNSTVLAVVEGYAFGGSPKAHSLGELGGVIKLMLWRMRIRTLIVPPTTLKKFVTGSGVGDKGNVMKDIYKHWGVETLDNNASDAAACAIMGYHWLCPDMLAPKYRKEALAKVEVILPQNAGTKTPVRRRVRALNVQPVA